VTAAALSRRLAPHLSALMCKRARLHVRVDEAGVEVDLGEALRQSHGFLRRMAEDVGAGLRTSNALQGLMQVLCPSTPGQPPPRHASALRNWYVAWASRLGAFQKGFDRAAATVHARADGEGMAASVDDVVYAGPVDACAPIGLVSGSDEVFQHDLYVPDLSGMERREAYVTAGHLLRTRVHRFQAHMEVIPEALAQALAAAMPAMTPGKQPPDPAAAHARLHSLVSACLSNVGPLASVGTFVEAIATPRHPTDPRLPNNANNRHPTDTRHPTQPTATQPHPTTTTAHPTANQPATTTAATPAPRRLMLRLCSSELSRLRLQARRAEAMTRLGPAELLEVLVGAVMEARHWSLLGPELAQVLSGALTRAHAAASTGHPTLSLSMGLVAASVAGTLILAAVKPSVAQHVALGFGGVGHARAVEDGTPVAVLSHEVTLCASPDPPRTHAFATGR